MRRRRTAILLCLSLVVLVGVSSAHGAHSSSRFDSPIPYTFLYTGAAATVGLTALGVGTRSGSAVSRRVHRLVPDLQATEFVVPPTLAMALRYGARGLFFACFVLVVLHGVLGPQTPAENFATVFGWGVWISGIGLFSMLVGSPWYVLSPWRTVYDGLDRLKTGELALIGEYPQRLQGWPALIGIVLVGFLENLTTASGSPSATATLIILYASIMTVGAVAFGEEWLRRADVFAVLYRQFGRVAPIESVRTDDDGYRLSIRSPLNGCTAPLRDLSLVFFVVSMVYIVSFDGFSTTASFQRTLSTVDMFGSRPGSAVLLYVLGLGVFWASFVVISGLIRRRASDGGEWRVIARAFAPTILPIAAAYELAHYYPYVLDSAGRLPAVVGSAVLGLTIEPIAPLGWLTLRSFWVSQVVLIIVGHLIAVIAAHSVATERYASVSMARKAHDPLVAMMIGYTLLSLWIIS